MKKNSYILLIATVTLLFSACQKEVEFDKKLIRPKLVINSFIETDSLIDVKVSASKTIPGLETSYKWLNDATVKLFVNDVEKEILQGYPIEIEDSEDHYWYYNNDTRPTYGYRTLNTRAENGKSYRIEVSHKDYDAAYAETSLPENPNLLSYESEEITQNYYGYDQRAVQISIRFKDKANEKNYYRINIKAFTGTWYPNFSEKDDTTGVIQLRTNYYGNVTSDDKLLNPDQEDANDFLFGSPNNSYNLFTDELIDGKEHELTFSISPNNNSVWYNGELMVFGEKPGEFYHLTIQLQALTRDAYLYMRSSYAQMWYGDDFFSEPVQAYSNIENGVGIFSGFSATSFEIKKGEYPVDGVVYSEDYY
ncbi:MAG: DUF4249 domain-containing protein [Prolixibacteraceae bacterium]|nr:DUF4249 domain-containing protein [Prolixibacteraceae bacterium]